jgi:hypothetical protein
MAFIGHSIDSLATPRAARHSAPSPQPCVRRTRKRAARAVCLTHSVLRRSEVRLAPAPGWRSTQHEAIAASQCASPLDSDLDATSPIASARTPRHRSRTDYWMEQPRRDRLLIPSLSADPFEEVRLIHRRAKRWNIPTADKVLSVGQQRCSVERSVSPVEIFQNDSLSYVQVSFRVLRLTSDPQRSRDQLRRLQRQRLEYLNGPGD